MKSIKKFFLFLFIISMGVRGLSYAQPKIPKESIPLDISAEVRKQIERLYSTELLKRIEGAYCLRKMGAKAAPAVPFLIASLHDRKKVSGVIADKYFVFETSFRKEARDALVSIGEPAVRPLIAALKDKTALGDAAYILGKIGDKRAVEPLINVLKDENRFNHSNVVTALGDIGDSLAVEPLITVLKDRKETKLARENAAVALTKLSKQGIGSLIEALNDEDSTVREFATIGVGKGKISDSRAIELLIANLKNKDLNIRVRSLAAWVLGGTNDTRAVKSLIVALEDEHWEVQSGAARALGKIGDKHAVETLIVTLKDEDAPVRQEAAWALGKIGDTRAVEPLISALKDTWVFVRLWAARALREIGDTRAVEQLIAILNDKDRLVREAAADTLKKITGEHFGQNQIKWQEWWEKNKHKFKKN